MESLVYANKNPNLIPKKMNRFGFLGYLLIKLNVSFSFTLPKDPPKIEHNHPAVTAHYLL